MSFSQLDFSDSELSELNNFLIQAIKNDYTAITKLLIKLGADVNVCNGKDQTALIYAARNNHADTVRLLIESGASVDAADYIDQTALIHTAWHNHVSTAQLLLEAGASVAAAGAFGTAHDVAVMCSYRQMANLLDGQKVLLAK